MNSNLLYDLVYFACVRPKTTVKLIVKLIFLFTNLRSSLELPKAAQDLPKCPQDTSKKFPGKKTLRRKKVGTTQQKFKL